MEDSVSFKAYLKREGQEVEVRRFGIDSGAATSYMYLRSKIQATFPSIQKDQFKVYWQDPENDYIQMDSDEEMLVALTTSHQQPFKIYIELQKNRNVGGSAGSIPDAADRLPHFGTICDGCNNPVAGFRYKCVTCPNFDLCSRCEHNGLHSEHFMLRCPTPIDMFTRHPKFIRKMLHPKKFHKRHGWSCPVPPPQCGEAQAGASRCSFSRRSGGVTNMFDFTALLDFIDSLGVERASQSANAGGDFSPPPTQASQATSSAQAATSSAEPATSSQPQAPPRRGSTPATQYLNNIGQMVASILDPLGVDVTFDVRTKAADQQQAAPIPTTTPPRPTPATTPPTTDVPSASSQTETTPATNTETQTEPLRERRNSDDWTLLNRESPARNEASAMDVDENGVAGTKTPPPSTSQTGPTPSAPPNTDDLSDAERKRIQEAIETFRVMGFNFNTNNLREMLKSQNCDIFSVLEMMLNAEKK